MSPPSFLLTFKCQLHAICSIPRFQNLRQCPFLIQQLNPNFHFLLSLLYPVTILEISSSGTI